MKQFSISLSQQVYLTGLQSYSFLLIKFSLSLALIFLFSENCQANFTNYNSLLIGDQSAGMGGAATAMDEDASGMAWYNPAGLAKLKGQSFSAAVGVYKKFDIQYRDDGDVTKSGLRVNQGFFRALPSSTGSVIRPAQIETLKDYTLALSILVPEYESFKGDISKQGESLSNFSLTTESLWVGGALAKKISGSESLGLSIYYTARSVSKSVSDRTYVNSTNSQIFTEERNYTQNGVVAIIGYHKDINDNWKLGVSYRFPSLSIAGSGEVTQTTINNGAIDTPISERDITTKASIPWKVSWGMAFVKPQDWTFASNIDYYGASSYSDLENDLFAERLEHKSIWNASLGFEKTWTNWLKTRIGFFTNFSSHPNPDSSLVKGQGDHVDQGGWSANLAFRSEKIEYTFGGYYTGGRGRSIQRINQQYQVVPKSVNIFTMLVGTSYYF